MSQRPLLRRPNQAANGRFQHVTPDNAGWHYVGFEAYTLSANETLSLLDPDNETCLVLLSGRADVQAGEQHYANIGQRESVFESSAPFAVYAPNGCTLSIQALTALELAVCKAPGKGTHPPRLIRPEQMSQETRGQATNTRHVCNILPEDQAADSLLVVEVRTPSGHWSSYPPHKHDQDNGDQESYLEETYYHRIHPPQGFAFQRIYTEDASLDETLTVQDQDVVLVPKGYHPFAAAHGYEAYYLNVMAGPRRTWIFHNHPDHAWLTKS